MYKLPKLSHSQHPLVVQGLGHLYLDASSQEWELSAESLNGSNHAIAHTLDQIYKQHKSDVGLADNTCIKSAHLNTYNKVVIKCLKKE